MNYEKKYKEALENAKQEYITTKNVERKQWLEELFPELKESEDERIRKECISIINAWAEACRAEGDYCEVAPICIAWLEKQGEKKPTEVRTIGYWRVEDAEQKPADKVEPKFKVGDVMRTLQEAANNITSGLPVVVSIDKEYYHCTNELIAIKDQDAYEYPSMNRKQKSADKTEPKFKVGDWIISKYMHLVMQILNNNGFYKTVETDRTERNDSYDFIERNFKLWTIQDAKDGDVLACENFIFIFKNIDDGNGVHYYCQYEISKHEDDNQFDIALPQSLMGRVGNSIIHYSPATKEQRDTLFKALTEAGYEWDADKKELKKIEQNPVTYEMSIEYAAKRFLDTLSHSPYNNRPVVDAQVVTEELLKFLANPSDYNPDAINMVKSGHAWNVEDSSKVQRICKYLDEAKKYYADITEVRECMDWLKSIEDRVQPRQKQEWSDEDETSIAINNEKAYKIGFSDGEAYAKEEMKSSWSDKDEENLQHCCGAVFAADYYTYEDKQDMEKWLLQLKERLS